MSAPLSADRGCGRNSALVPAHLGTALGACPTAAPGQPEAGPKPSNLLSMNHGETRPLVGRNGPLVCPYLSTPQKSMAELEYLVSLTLIFTPLTQSL